MARDVKDGVNAAEHSATQFVSFFGRAGQERVFYMGGVSSGGEDPEGGDARDGFARVMVEAVPGVYVGGFFVGGTNATRAVDLDFRRAGVDFQVEQGNLDFYGMVLNANDDLLTGRDQDHTIGYVEGFYTIPFERFPMLVPLARVDALDDFTNLTLQLSAYMVDNVKVYESGPWVGDARRI